MFVAAGTTLSVSPTVSLDPINLPKFFFMLTISGGIFGLLIHKLKRPLIKFVKHIIVILGFFLVWMFFNFFFTNGQFEQKLFGTYGRNTGFITYLCFVILFISGLISRPSILKVKFKIALGIALSINTIYGLFQYLGVEPFHWAKLYSPIIGTLGNPNFYSAFLGMGVAFSFPFIFFYETKKVYRLLIPVFIFLSLFLIYKSDSQQGFLVIAGAAGLSVYFILRLRESKKLISRSYLVIYLTSILITIFGLLQKGPLGSLIYQPSITYRGDYWRSGLKMMEHFPFFGVGLDSFGNWYRTYRTTSAIQRRGPSAVTDAAHNVFIDLGSTAGIPVLIAYISLIIVTLFLSFKFIMKSENFDPFFIGLLSMWIAYLIQSSISINNLALGVWGWLIPGILLSYTRVEQVNEIFNKSKLKRNSTKFIDFSGMTFVAGMVLFGVIGFLPFNADTNFRHSLETASEVSIMNAATKWPKDTSRMLYAVQVFSDNNLNEQASNLARQIVAYNENSFNAWTYLYESNLTDKREKDYIKAKLIKLDPNNYEVKKLN